MNLVSRLKTILIDYWPLILIIAAAGCLRFYGIYFDYPRVNFIWDETYDMAYLMNILDKRTLFPPTMVSSYPILLPCIYLPTVIIRIVYLAWREGIYNLADLKNYLLSVGVGELYIVSRWYAAAFGTATVYLIYKIFKLVYNKFTAYFASGAIALSIIPIFISHWGKQHSVMAFFAILSLYLALKFEKTKRGEYFIGSVAAAGLAISTHYVGMTALIFPILAWWQNRKSFNWSLLLRSSVVFALVVGFFYLMNLKGVTWMFGEMFFNYYGKNGGAIMRTGFWERFYYLFRDSFLIDPVFVAVSLVIMALNFHYLWRGRLTRYLLAGLMFNYLLMITIIVGPGMTRWYLIFSILLIATGIATAVFKLTEKGLGQRIIIGGALIFFLPNLIVAGWWLSLLNHNTLLDASAWLASNYQQEDNVYLFNTALYAPLSYEAAVWNTINNGVDGSAKTSYILAHPEIFSHQGVNFMYDKYHYRYQALAGTSTKFVMTVFASSSEGQLYEQELLKYHQMSLAASFYPTNDPGLLSVGIDDELNNPLDWRHILKTKKSGYIVNIYEIVQ